MIIDKKLLKLGVSEEKRRKRGCSKKDKESVVRVLGDCDERERRLEEKRTSELKRCNDDPKRGWQSGEDE